MNSSSFRYGIVNEDDLAAAGIVACSQQHSAALLACKLCGLEVCNEDYLLADQILGSVELCNTRNDLSLLVSEVYLQAKKKQAAPGMNMYIVDGEDVGLWELSQRFGVKVQNLARMNNVTVNHVFSDGQIIKLRK